MSFLKQQFNKLSKRIIAGFAAVAVLIAVTGSVGLGFINSFERTLSYVTETTTPTVTLTGELKNAMYEANGLVGLALASTDISEIENYNTQFDAASTAFSSRYQRLESLVAEPSIRATLAESMNARRDFEQQASILFEHHRTGLLRAAEVRRRLTEFDRIAAFLIGELGNISFHAEQVAQDVELTSAATNLQSLVMEIQYLTRDYLSQRSTITLPPLAEELEQVFEIFDFPMETLNDRADANIAASVSEVESLLAQWREAAFSEGALLLSYELQLESETDAALSASAMAAEIEAVNEALNQVELTAIELNEKSSQQAAAKVRSALWIIATVVIAGFVLAVVVG